MRTNGLFIILLVFGCLLHPIGLFSQVLKAERHRPLPTDSFVVYKLPYIQVNDTGHNCIWDFSDLPMDSAEVLDVNYFSVHGDTSHIGVHREHANYYYHLQEDTLWLTGCENSRTHVRYSTPIVWMSFPMGLSDSISGRFAGRGQYCHFMPINMEGTYTTRVDALGRLILPDIEIEQALLIHAQSEILDAKHSYHKIQEDRHMWYSPYCRYPLVETIYIQTINHDDTISFSASYYNPQEQEVVSEESEEIIENLMDSVDNLITNVSYLPNPVHRDLNVSYSLSRSANVYISVHYNGGVSSFQTPIHIEDEGEHVTSINMSGLPIGGYVVYIHADDAVVSGNIIKY